MATRDTTDIVAGSVLMLVGLGAAGYSAASYDLGRLNYMGPGMFPMGSGLVLALFGALIALPAFFRSGEAPSLNLRAAAAVLAGVALFAASVGLVGLVPASVLLVLVAALGDRQSRPLGTLVLAVVLAAICWLIFKLGLGITLPAFRWPL